MIAIIVFEQVNTYLGEIFRILKFMTEAAGIACAGHDAAAGIHAEFKSL